LRTTKKILVTGGAGFIGSEFVRQAVHKDQEIIVADKLTYAGDLKRLACVKNIIKFYKIDIANTTAVNNLIKKEKPQILVHFATETHVDRSILDAKPFYRTNVLGTQNLVEAALKFHVKKFIHISTDEVYGEIFKGSFKEDAPLNPGNPYSASKASADLLIKAAIRTYKLPAIIVRPSNNYGPWQYPEKFIPVIILKAHYDKRVPVYGKGAQIREWTHVNDCTQGIYTIIKKGVIGEIYNLSSGQQQKNIKTAQDILNGMGKSQNLIKFVKDRPGHDFRYSLSCNKLRKLGWRPKISLTQGLIETIQWNQRNISWLNNKKRKLKIYWKKVYKPL